MPRATDPRDGTTFVTAIVGIDGCGKSSAFRSALGIVAGTVDAVGIGDEVLSGAPGAPPRPRDDLPLARPTTAVARAARRTRRAWAYRQLKTLDLIGRSRLRDHVVAGEAPAALLTDGDPLVNTVAWCIGRLYRSELDGADDRIVDVIGYLAGDRSIPVSELPTYLRHAPQLVALNRLGLARFRSPDLVVHLEIDGATAMERIRGRGRPLQRHETVEALDSLEAGYQLACRLLEDRCAVEVIHVPCTRISPEEVAATVAAAVLGRLPEPAEADPELPAVDVVATTISGSLADQRKVGRIGPEFRHLTRRPVRVHEADSHPEARALAHEAVMRGGRLIVSAGGAGTFNAVLEGCHLDDAVPADLRLAFLRKGSADLLGKMLRIPDELRPAAAAIVDGFDHDRQVEADVLAVEAPAPDGEPEQRHLVGFGGLGVFGEVPRFTESRVVKLYKGILSQLFGDYGPFYTGLALATVWWYAQRWRGRVQALTLELDGEVVGPARWASVVVVNGDLGPAFPLGRGLALSSGTLRVVALRDTGLRGGLRQLAAARSGRLLDDPERYAALVREVRTLEARPSARTAHPYMVNVDGLRMLTRDPVRFGVSGRVRLVAGPDAAP